MGEGETTAQSKPGGHLQESIPRSIAKLIRSKELPLQHPQTPLDKDLRPNSPQEAWDTWIDSAFPEEGAEVKENLQVLLRTFMSGETMANDATWVKEHDAQIQEAPEIIIEDNPDPYFKAATREGKIILGKKFLLKLSQDIQTPQTFPTARGEQTFDGNPQLWALKAGFEEGHHRRYFAYKEAHATPEELLLGLVVHGDKPEEVSLAEYHTQEHENLALRDSITMLQALQENHNPIAHNAQRAIDTLSDIYDKSLQLQQSSLQKAA